MATEAPPPAVEPLPCPVDYADEARYHQYDVWRWVSAAGQALILKEERSVARQLQPQLRGRAAGGGAITRR